MRKNSPQFMNKKHNYSIRKFTFGTASIVVGATLFFGAGQAHAAEQGQQSDDTTTTTQSSQDNGNQDSEDAVNGNDQSNQPEQDTSDQTSQYSPDTSETETQNAQNSNSGNTQSEDTNDNQDSEAQNEDNTQTPDNEQDTNTSTSSNDQTSSNQSSDQDNTNNDKSAQEQPKQADDNQNSESKPSNSEQTTDNKAENTNDSTNSNAENNNDQNSNSNSSQPQSANDTTYTNSNMKQSTSKNDENNSNSAQNKTDSSAQQAPQSSQEQSPKHDKETKDTSASSSQDTTQATQNPNSQQSTNDDGDNNQASDHNKDTFFSVPQTNDDTNSQQDTTNIHNQSDLVNHYKDQTGNQMSESDLNEIAENSDIDFDKDDQATIQQKFLESAAKDYSDKKNATTLFATPVSTTSATNQNESTSFRDAEPTTEEAGNNDGSDDGSDVSDNVHFSDLNLSGVNPNNPDNKDNVEIGNNGYLRFKGNYKLDNSVKSGDYFYVDYGDYVRPTGLEDPIVPEDLKSYNDNGSQTVATAKYDPDTNKVKYTFTDFVDQHKDVKGSFDFVAYPNRRNATDSFKDYPIDIDVAGEKYSTNLQFDYVHQSDYVSSFWDSRSQDHKHQSRTTYLNEGYHPMNHSIVTISTQGSNLSNLQIYKSSSKDQMVDSYVPNYEDLEDVTDQYDIQYNDDGTEATIDFGYDLDGQGFIINTKSDAYEDADNITETTTIENQLGNGLSDFYDYHNYLSRFMQGSGAEPDVPTNPDQPTDPTEPTNPGEPTDPTEPVNPGDPTNPGTPPDPTQPVNPGDPTNPGTPPDPTQPGQPTNPGEPTNPGTPTDPGTPVNPNNPNEPVNPNNPNNPQNPQNPNNPTNPNNPQNPQNPNNPNQPTPGTPTTPEATHGTPGTPTSPNSPESPNNPNTPNTPTVNPVTHHDNGVTGQHGTPGNTITVTYPDGTTTHATVNPDGTWNAPTPEHVNLKSGDTVTVVEQDAQGHTTQVTEVAVDQTQQPVRGTAQGLPESGQHESNNAGISIMAALGGILAFFGIRRRKADK